MSKTFTSKPSVSNSRGRAGMNNQRSYNQRGRGIGTQSNNRGAGQVGRGQSFGRSYPTTNMQNSGRHRLQQPGTSEYESRPSPQRPGRAAEQEDDPSSQEATSQSGQYEAGYTKFEPNVRKRQQVSEMARREAEEYQRFKETNAVKYCNYVGTTGGGQVSEEDVRRRQANDVRNQKFNRLQNQQRRREEQKEVEQQQNDRKKSLARRKAEENDQRQRNVDAEEIRRKREAFLRRLENQS